MAQKTMVGARAKVRVNGQIVGLFDSCQYGANIGTEPIHILGRYSADEISITSYEAVQVACSGFRIIDQGVHVLPAAPQLQDLLNFESVQIEVEDRQSGKNIMIVKNCVPSNWGEAEQAKGTTRFNITYIGTILSDESGDQDEADQASTLP
tara:strand:+ start:2384 stop:2836 length:453 start_codon:yes stop_codon:yes gene_type:complete